METDVSGEYIPVKFWYSDEAKNNELSQDKKITTFEEGKTYMYSISLKAKDENKFGSNISVRVNNTEINSANVKSFETTLFVTAVKTIKPTKSVQLKHIDIIELNNATISFNVMINQYLLEKHLMIHHMYISLKVGKLKMVQV